MCRDYCQFEMFCPLKTPAAEDGLLLSIRPAKEEACGPCESWSFCWANMFGFPMAMDLGSIDPLDDDDEDETVLKAILLEEEPEIVT